MANVREPLLGVTAIRPKMKGHTKSQLHVSLITINHGDAIVRGELSVGRGVRIVLTMLVPYGVSTFASVEAMRNRRDRVRNRTWSACR